jgi:anthranilate synthase component 1
MPHYLPDLADFTRLARSLGEPARADEAARGSRVVPVFRRLISDQLTPVIAYRRLVRPDDRMAPSFLFESVVGGERIARYSFLGAQPRQEIIAHDRDVQFIDHDRPEHSRRFRSEDPIAELQRLTSGDRFASVPGLPEFTGGWVGFAGYDTVRYLEGEKLASPPPDDRRLPDLHMGMYRQLVAFDHVQKTTLVITNVLVDQFGSIEDAYREGCRELDELVARIETPPRLAPGVAELAVGDVDLATPPPKLPVSNMGDGGYQRAVGKAKEYIAAGDVFQVVPSQRFELRTGVDPFDIYRALRIVNPSPYMFYLQIEGGMLVGSSPEILCKVHDGVVTNRPLAGTRRRGATEDEDQALEAELLADPKERAEHIMLVDLGRNDVGRVARPGSIALPDVMVVERYSHVMHISSTVTGKLREGATCWDALRTALPVGTVSGAPKVRAMQIIDELEPSRRGPYAGAVGYADFAGNMDMAIALRTMVVMLGERPEGLRPGGLEEVNDTGSPPKSSSLQASKPSACMEGERPEGLRPEGLNETVAAASPPKPSSLRATKPPSWIVHLQAGGGIVADSDPDAEHQETVNKAAALAKAVDLAERAFGRKA